MSGKNKIKHVGGRDETEMKGGRAGRGVGVREKGQNTKRTERKKEIKRKEK